MSAELLDLPETVLENILSFLDAKSLRRASSVCSDLKYVSNFIARTRCLKQIPIEMLRELNPDLPDDLKEENIGWENIYLRWKNSAVPPLQPQSVNLIKFKEQVTCFRVSGDLILIGSAVGKVKILNSKGQHLFTVYEGNSPILDVTSLDSQGSGLYPLYFLSKQYQSEGDLLLFATKGTVAIYNLPSFLTSSELWKGRFTCKFNRISVFGRFFCIAENFFTLVVYQVKKRSCSLQHQIQVSRVHRIGFLDQLHTWQLWGDKVLSVLHSGHLAVWCMDNPSKITLHRVHLNFMRICHKATSINAGTVSMWGHCNRGVFILRGRRRISAKLALILYKYNPLEKKYLPHPIGHFSQSCATCIKKRVAVIANPKAGKLELLEFRTGGKFTASSSLTVSLPKNPKVMDVGFTDNGTIVAGLTVSGKEIWVVEWNLE